MTFKTTNNGASTLAGAINAVATSLSLFAGDGLKFPVLTGSDYFMLTLTKLVSGLPVREIVKVTARTVDVCTIVRAQEGTTATTFSGADSVELRLTSGMIDGLAKLDATNTFTAPQKNATAPASPEDYANKAYVDSKGSGLAQIQAVILSF